MCGDDPSVTGGDGTYDSDLARPNCDADFMNAMVPVWYGVVGPAGMPPAVVTRLHQEVQRALAAPEVRERLASASGEAAPGTTAMFADMLKREQQRYEKLIRDANIKPD